MLYKDWYVSLINFIAKIWFDKPIAAKLQLQNSVWLVAFGQFLLPYTREKTPQKCDSVMLLNSNLTKGAKKSLHNSNNT